MDIFAYLFYLLWKVSLRAICCFPLQVLLHPWGHFPLYYAYKARAVSLKFPGYWSILDDKYVVLLDDKTDDNIVPLHCNFYTFTQIYIDTYPPSYYHAEYFHYSTNLHALPIRPFPNLPTHGNH